MEEEQVRMEEDERKNRKTEFEICVRSMARIQGGNQEKGKTQKKREKGKEREKKKKR